MIKALKTVAFLALAWLLPGTAMAERLDPGGGRNAWDYFVYGNGPAIVEILTSLKLMLAPDAGEPVFKYIMLFLAVVGFVILAAKAGFNPQQNFLKMFSFLLVVWFVNYATTGLKANVNVVDRLNGYSNVVTGVPAIVAIPASVVSQTGEWMTRQIEQNFSIPGEITMSGGGAYDLVGRVMSDANKVMFTDDNLKRTVSSYISNCMVPAMAMGRVSINDFTKSKSLLDTLGEASHNALSTVYFAPEGRDEPCGFMAADTGMGGVDSCARVYACLRVDLENHANALVDAGSEAWEKTGVFIPLETALSTALSMSGSDAGPFAGYGRPQGYILQRAMISHMGGAFRNAATMTGNNELMMATSVAQAEQSQRTSWAVAADIFNNMMGYVYLVLQAFILAIVPIVIISLMIPGLGGKVLINYGQILIWLTLWSPMLAIINFLIALFWQQQMNSVGLANGLDMYNAGLMTAQTANLQIAAQFLGTMVPILTWGLVKGSMAFTEFISSGIGSSFATQAGAQGATGNISMGNLSMDNVGMNKYNTAMSANVGFQDTNAFQNAGTATSVLQGGGSTATMNGGSATQTQKASEGINASSQFGVDYTSQRSVSASIASSAQQTIKTATNRQSQIEEAISQKEAASRGKSLDNTDTVSRSQDNSAQKGAAIVVDESEQTLYNATLGASGGAGLGTGGKGGKSAGGNDPGNNSASPGEVESPSLPGAKANVDVKLAGQVSATDGASRRASADQKVDTSTRLSETDQAQLRETLGSTSSSDKSFKEALSQASSLSIEDLKSIQQSLQETKNAARAEYEKHSWAISSSASTEASMPMAINDLRAPAQLTDRNQVVPNAEVAAANAREAYDEQSSNFRAGLAATQGAIAAGTAELATGGPQNNVSNAPTIDGNNAQLAAANANMDRMAAVNERFAALTDKLVGLSFQDINVDALSAMQHTAKASLGDRLGFDVGNVEGLPGIIGMVQTSSDRIGERFINNNMSEEDYKNVMAALDSLENQINLQADPKKNQ